MTPRLVIAGNLLVDDVVFSDGRTRMGEAGGAVLHAALAASLWGPGVGCLSRRGADYPAAALAALAARGVDLAGVRALPGLAARTWLLYEGALRRMVPHLGRPSHEEASPGPEDLPAAWAGARAVHLAPMPRACQGALLAALPPEALVSLDPHLPIDEETLPGWRPLLQRVDVLFVGEDELRLGGGLPGVAALAGGRLRLVLCKRGARGGVLHDLAAGREVPWAARAADEVDPTGCGDAFAASFMTGLLDGESNQGALLRGVVAASFALGGWGAGGLLAATPAQAAERLRAWADGGLARERRDPSRPDGR